MSRARLIRRGAPPTPSASRLVSLAALLALAAPAVASCTIEVQERHLLFPWPAPLAPVDERIARRNLELTTADGVTLRGWLLDVPDERFTLLYYYGNAQSVVGAAYELYSLAERLHADVACVDYRGYGFSGGQPTFELLAQDAVAVFDLVRARTRGPVVAMGYSLGTGAAVMVASRRDTAALVLVAPPASPSAMVAHMESSLPWYARLFFDLEPAPALRRLAPVPDTAIRQVTEPLLVVHGTADTVVPIAQGRRMYRLAASRRKRFCEIPGEDHAIALHADPGFGECLVSFLDDIARASR